MNTPRDVIEEGSDNAPPSDEIRAGEYVLGVLDLRERRQMQARIVGDSAFAALIDAWERRFAPWTLRVAPAAPSPEVWLRVNSRLGWPLDLPARPRAWNDARYWRLATGLAAAAAIGGVVFGLRGGFAPLPPVPIEEQAAKPVTVLARDDGSTGWIASIDLAQNKLLMVPVPSPADSTGRVNELWIIPEGQAPISLGFVSNEKTHSIAIPDRLRRAIAVGSTLAITLEPQAGMPHAAPSGPIVAKGAILRI